MRWNVGRPRTGSIKFYDAPSRLYDSAPVVDVHWSMTLKKMPIGHRQKFLSSSN